MNSTLPSAEPLSTTITSLSGWPAAASTTETRYFSSRSLPFQFGITIEAEVARGGAEVDAARRRLNRSLTSKVSNVAIVSSGDSNNNGSVRRNRLRKAMLTGGLVRPQPEAAAEFHPTR